MKILHDRGEIRSKTNDFPTFWNTQPRVGHRKTQYHFAMFLVLSCIRLPITSSKSCRQVIGCDQCVNAINNQLCNRVLSNSANCLIDRVIGLVVRRVNAAREIPCLTHGGGRVFRKSSIGFMAFGLLLFYSIHRIKFNHYKCTYRYFYAST